MWKILNEDITGYEDLEFISFRNCKSIRTKEEIDVGNKSENNFGEKLNNCKFNWLF